MASVSAAHHPGSIVHSYTPSRRGFAQYAIFSDTADLRRNLHATNGTLKTLLTQAGLGTLPIDRYTHEVMPSEGPHPWLCIWDTQNPSKRITVLHSQYSQDPTLLQYVNYLSDPLGQTPPFIPHTPQAPQASLATPAGPPSPSLTPISSASPQTLSGDQGLARIVEIMSRQQMQMHQETMLAVQKMNQETMLAVQKMHSDTLLATQTMMGHMDRRAQQTEASLQQITQQSEERFLKFQTQMGEQAQKTAERMQAFTLELLNRQQQSAPAGPAAPAAPVPAQQAGPQMLQPPAVAIPPAVAGAASAQFPSGNAPRPYLAQGLAFLRTQINPLPQQQAQRISPIYTNVIQRILRNLPLSFLQLQLLQAIANQILGQQRILNADETAFLRMFIIELLKHNNRQSAAPLTHSNLERAATAIISNTPAASILQLMRIAGQNPNN